MRMPNSQALTVVLYAADGTIIGVEELSEIEVEAAKACAFDMLDRRADAAGAELWQGDKRLAARGTELLHIPRGRSN